MKRMLPVIAVFVGIAIVMSDRLLAVADPVLSDAGRLLAPFSLLGEPTAISDGGVLQDDHVRPRGLSELGFPFVPDGGQGCGKTVFIDLGNEKQRKQALAGRFGPLPDDAVHDQSARIGSSLTTGSLSIRNGCTFEPATIQSTDYVRVVLLNARHDMTYRLVLDNGLTPAPIHPPSVEATGELPNSFIAEQAALHAAVYSAKQAFNGYADNKGQAAKGTADAQAAASESAKALRTASATFSKMVKALGNKVTPALQPDVAAVQSNLNPSAPPESDGGSGGKAGSPKSDAGTDGGDSAILAAAVDDAVACDIAEWPQTDGGVDGGGICASEMLSRVEAEVQPMEQANPKLAAALAEVASRGKVYLEDRRQLCEDLQTSERRIFEALYAPASDGGDCLPRDDDGRLPRVLPWLTQWAEMTEVDLENYFTVDELLEIVRQRSAELESITKDGRRWAGDEVALLDSLVYYHSKWLKLSCEKAAVSSSQGGFGDGFNTSGCADGGRCGDSRFEEILSKMHHVRSALDLLQHAQEARSFGVQQASGNTDIALNVLVSPAATGATDGGAADDGSDIVPYHFEYHVGTRQILSASVGFAEPIVREASPPYDTRAVFGSAAIFLGAHFAWVHDTDKLGWVLHHPCTWDSWGQALGIGVGVPVEDLGASLLTGNLPHYVFIGPQFWFTPQVMITGGPAWFNTNATGMGWSRTIGGYGAVAVDVPSLVNLISATTKALPH